MWYVLLVEEIIPNEIISKTLFGHTVVRKRERNALRVQAGIEFDDRPPSDLNIREVV